MINLSFLFCIFMKYVTIKKVINMSEKKKELSKEQKKTNRNKMLGKALKQMRLEAKVSQASVNKQLGEPANYLSDIELGKVKIGLGTITKLCSIYNTSPARLMAYFKTGK